MKFLIAGLGSIGRRHLRNLIALGERDISLFRTHQSTLPEDDLKGFPVEVNLASALAKGPRAVIVSNPTALHLDVAIPSAQAGCHIFLEKPVSHSLERVHELVAAARQGGAQVFVGYQFRFHPGLLKVKELLTSGAIGRPLSIRAHWGEYLPGWHPWEDYRNSYSARADLGGGVVLTLCHPLDYLRWFFGDVDSLWAFTSNLGELELDVEDTAEIGLHFVDGAIGSVHLNYNQRPSAHRLEIIGSQGTIRWNNADGATRLHSTSRDPANESTNTWQSWSPPPGFERNDLFLAQMSHFLAVINGQAKPLCGLDDGIQALRLALAVHKSQKYGEMVHL